MPGQKSETHFDYICVGAGIAGLATHRRMTKIGLRGVLLEKGNGVGGTWYWNRYPGARCDVESFEYSFSELLFDENLQQEWNWSSRYPPQPEILKYLNHVADKYNIKQDIHFNTKVTGMDWHEDEHVWTVHSTSTEGHAKTLTARFVICATGCLSVPKKAEYEGMEKFKGKVYSTSSWPEDAEFKGKRVVVIGTGSSGIQCIPVLAKEAKELEVFQRTPNFSIPAQDRLLKPEEISAVKSKYVEKRFAGRTHPFGIDLGLNLVPAMAVPEDVRNATFEKAWEKGGFYIAASFLDLLSNYDANMAASEFVRRKIRGTVKDPKVGEMLCPKNHPILSKRICVDVDYYNTFNRPNVRLVDIKANPIAEFAAEGPRLKNGELHECDVIVLATGFDAITGAVNSLNIKGRGGAVLKQKWLDGPKTYLGLQVANFPNLFLITGPQSPSVFSNMVLSIEEHVEFIGKSIEYVLTNQFSTMEADAAAQQDWVTHCADVGNKTVIPLSQDTSWYLGTNCPGKKRMLLFYAGGVFLYHQKLQQVIQNNYRGFSFTPARLQSGFLEQWGHQHSAWNPHYFVLDRKGKHLNYYLHAGDQSEASRLHGTIPLSGATVSTDGKADSQHEISLRWGGDKSTKLRCANQGEFLHWSSTLRELSTDQKSAAPDRRDVSEEFKQFEMILSMFPKPSPTATPDELLKFLRVAWEGAGGMAPVIPGSTVTPVTIPVTLPSGKAFESAGVWVYHGNVQPKDTLVWFHGGAFCACSVRSHTGIASALAKYTGCRVLLPSYPLVPEFPLTDSIDCGHQVYKYALSQGGKVLVGGDSAGANIAILVAQAAAVRPQAVVAVCPWGDLSFKMGVESLKEFPNGCSLLPLQALQFLQSVIATNNKDTPLDSPKVSSLYGKFEQFPPCYITSGGHESLRDQSRALVHAISKSNYYPRIVYDEVPWLCHNYALFIFMFGEAMESMERIGGWVQSLLK